MNLFLILGLFEVYSFISYFSKSIAKFSQRNVEVATNTSAEVVCHV